MPDFNIDMDTAVFTSTPGDQLDQALVANAAKMAALEANAKGVDPTVFVLESIATATKRGVAHNTEQGTNDIRVVFSSPYPTGVTPNISLQSHITYGIDLTITVDFASITNEGFVIKLYATGTSKDNLGAISWTAVADYSTDVLP